MIGGIGQSIVCVDENYYLTHPGFVHSRGLQIWHSRDLVSWQPISTALDGCAGDIGAPDIIYHDGLELFYIYVPINGKIMALFSPTPFGRWSEPIDLYITGSHPCHIIDKKGNRFLYFSAGSLICLSESGLSTRGKCKKYAGVGFEEAWRTCW